MRILRIESPAWIPYKITWKQHQIIWKPYKIRWQPYRIIWKQCKIKSRRSRSPEKSCRKFQTSESSIQFVGNGAITSPSGLSLWSFDSRITYGFIRGIALACCAPLFKWLSCLQVTYRRAFKRPRYEIHVKSYEIHIKSYEIHVRSYEIHMREYELYMKSYETNIKTWNPNQII